MMVKQLPRFRFYLRARSRLLRVGRLQRRGRCRGHARVSSRSVRAFVVVLAAAVEAPRAEHYSGVHCLLNELLCQFPVQPSVGLVQVWVAGTVVGLVSLAATAAAHMSSALRLASGPFTPAWWWWRYSSRWSCWISRPLMEVQVVSVQHPRLLRIWEIGGGWRSGS